MKNEKTAKKADDGDVSKEADTSIATQEPTNSVSLLTLTQGLSQSTVERLALELKEKLHAISIGLDDKTKASMIMKRGDVFTIIDAFMIKGFVDKNTGDISDKMVFVLEFPQGDMQVVMQSDTRPRREIVETFEIARALSGHAKFGPYLMAEKDTGKPQPALIFVRQPGFKAVVM